MLLENGVVRVVLDAPSHPSGLAPSGGSIIDLALVSEPGDQINQIYQAAGLLPRDAVHYEGNPEPLIFAPRARSRIPSASAISQ
jgi:hypothetical protein